MKPIVITQMIWERNPSNHEEIGVRLAATERYRGATKGIRDPLVLGELGFHQRTSNQWEIQGDVVFMKYNCVLMEVFHGFTMVFPIIL